MESEVAATPASPMAVLGGSLAAYWRFHEAVAKAQLAAWLPGRRRLLVDISGPTAKSAQIAAALGHTVVRVIPVYPGSSAADAGARASEGHAALGLGRWPSKDAHTPAGSHQPGAPGHMPATGPGSMGDHVRAGGHVPAGSLPTGSLPADSLPAGSMPASSMPAASRGPARHSQAGASGRQWAGWSLPASKPVAGYGRIVPVLAEPGSLAFLADGCADGVIAEEGALSRHLMAEDLAAEIARVLRPGGELLACVDSLVLGMAILAEQHHWAHLIDLPHMEVVLIPWPDGTITRCFGAGQLTDLLTEVGLEVSWIRPRTLLSPSMVDHVLRQEPGAIARLVRAELQAGDDSSAGSGPEESFGIRLLAAARKAPANGRHLQ
jgi:hypothetical protein